jgi:hypothetical protein
MAPDNAQRGDPMKRKTRTVTTPSQSMEMLTIRTAVPTDAPALARLAQLDSARPPEQLPMLVAVADGELCAALPLNGGTAIANPFRRTAEIVAMLAARTQQLQAQTPSRRRWRPIRVSRAARAGVSG